MNTTTKAVKPRTRQANLAKAIARRAFEHGFAEGADALRTKNKRHVVDEATHHHWRAGFEAGKDAVAKAANAYEATLP